MPTGRSGVQGLEEIAAMRRMIGRAERRFRTGTDLAFRQEVVKFARRSRNIIIQATPQGKTGESGRATLRSSTFSRIVYQGKDAIQMLVGQSLETESGLNVAELLASGTGIYGPRNRLITPVNKKAIAWPGGDHPVPYTKGVKKNPYFRDALARIEAEQEVAMRKFMNDELLEIRSYMRETGFQKVR